MSEHQVRCPKCSGKGKITMKSKRCKLGVHKWHFKDYLPQRGGTFRWLRECGRCGRIEQCEFGVTTTGEGYQHCFELKKD